MYDVRQLPVPTIPNAASIDLKLLEYADSHSIGPQYPRILRSLSDQRQEIRHPPQLKPERTYYSAMTARRTPRKSKFGPPCEVLDRLEGLSVYRAE
jgi:hypothetical protein